MSELHRLYDVASDTEAALLDDLQVRAGLLWVCEGHGHTWTNRSGEPCEECGRTEPEREG